MDQVGSALKRIDSDPEVLDAFKSLLEDILGGDIEAIDETSRDMTPGFPPNAGMLAAPAAPGPFGSKATGPADSRFANSAASRLLVCFMDALVDAVVPGSELLNAADPVLADGVAKLRVRTEIAKRCHTTISDFEACDRGDDPVMEQFNKGDYAGAHKTARKEALAGIPTPTSQPPTATVPPPTLGPTAPPPPTVAPTREPTAPPVGLTPEAPVSYFGGTWLGRYSGVYTHDFPICGTTLPIEGSVSAVLVQTGSQITGTATLGGSDVLEIQESEGVCSIVAAADETIPISATVSGQTMSSAPGSPVVFTMTKSSENSADGTSKDPWLTATFFVGRLR